MLMTPEGTSRAANRRGGKELPAFIFAFVSRAIASEDSSNNFRG
jgi:hypothetical protein